MSRWEKLSLMVGSISLAMAIVGLIFALLK